MQMKSTGVLQFIFEQRTNFHLMEGHMAWGGLLMSIDTSFITSYCELKQCVVTSSNPLYHTH